MKLLIGLSGKKRSGKDTAATMIREALPHHNVVTLSFALPLKAFVARAYNISVEQLENEKARWRKALQFTGSYCRELYGDDYWIRQVNVQLNQCTDTDVVIITDVRYRNEADYVRKLGGVVVRVNRPNVDTLDMHSSEIELDNYEHFWYKFTAMDLANLRDEVNNITKKLHEQHKL